MKWSTQDEARLREMYQNTTPIAEIAKILGRSKNAVKCKAAGMGLKWGDTKVSHPIYSPPAGVSESQSKIVIEDLIAFEWENMERMRAFLEACPYDKHKGQYWLAMAAHARILATLLKDAGRTGEPDSLAKLFQRLEKKIRKFVRDVDREIHRFGAA